MADLSRAEIKERLDNLQVPKAVRQQALLLADRIPDPFRRAEAKAFLRNNRRTQTQIEAFIKRMS